MINLTFKYLATILILMIVGIIAAELVIQIGGALQ